MIVISSHISYLLIAITIMAAPAYAQLSCRSLFLTQRPADTLGFTRTVDIHRTSSKALRDPLIEEARELRIHDDFKTLSDLSARSLTASEKENIYQKAHKMEAREGRRSAVEFLLKELYVFKSELQPVDHPSLKLQWTLQETSHKATFEHIEKMWSVLTRQTPAKTNSSLIPLPNPILIPGARFQEGYYWDTFFAIPSLLRTGRGALVRGQIDNFLFLIQNYGLVPNGTRDYYLTRSQPPMLSQMVRLFVEHEMKNGGLSPETEAWLGEKVYPLIKKDYLHFWMNPKTRYDKKTELNHHFDDLNTPRPERHSSDKENEIANSYRDVRAEAESGKDFTDAYEGEATHMATVTLNSVLFMVEKDLAWMAKIQNNVKEQQEFLTSAKRRQHAMNRFLLDSKTGAFFDYNLRTQKPSQVLTADTFLPLYAGLVSRPQAQNLVNLLPRLERQGGLMMAEKESGKQWDAPYGWAPFHFFAMSGLQRYGYKTEAQRIAEKWVRTIDKIYASTGKIIEKIDALRGDVPIETGDKYPTQDGFLWTNGVYVWSLTDVLGVKPILK